MARLRLEPMFVSLQRFWSPLGGPVTHDGEQFYSEEFLGRVHKSKGERWMGEMGQIATGVSRRLCNPPRLPGFHCWQLF